MMGAMDTSQEADAAAEGGNPFNAPRTVIA